MTHTIDILGIGNAIMDILTHCDDAHLEKVAVTKGSMGLIDEEAADAQYAALTDFTQCSGGSAANTLAALASMDTSCAFIGKIHDDTLGSIFRMDMRMSGVKFDTEAALEGLPTARCLVYVTPDAERSMATFLGACTNITSADIDADLIKASAITYVEGYLWDGEETIAAIEEALEIAKNAGNKTAFTLSDSFCVERHREAFLKLASQVDILFANEDEIRALYETDTLEAALEQVKKQGNITAITQSANGATIVSGKDVIHVPTAPVERLVDTTGAGDLFASGFLHGIVENASLEQSARYGHAAAGYIIGRLGARSDVPMLDVVQDAKAA